MEDEMESYRDGIYNQLKLLLQTPNKRLSATIKKDIHVHLANFNWGETWMEDGEYLLGRAYADIGQRQSALEKNWEDSSWLDDSYDDYEARARKAEERFEQQVALWEGRLDNQKTKNDGYDAAHGPSGHRAGTKRDKTEFWSRPNPTRWRKHLHTLREKKRKEEAAKH